MFDFSPENQVLFEDNHLIIVNKLPSQIVQGDKSGDMPLNEMVKSYLKDKYNKPGNVFLGVVHRLDRPVSGALIFARTSKALSRLNAMLQNREIKKYYMAVVKNKLPKDKDHLINYLLRDQKQNKTFVVKENRAGAKKAELIYELIKTSNNYSLLEIELLTGRHHQIRAQLAKIGCPVKGDLKYGFARSNRDGSIHLHARKLIFAHPVSKERIEIEATFPYDPLWNVFA